MYCKKCGQPLEDNVNFCPHCGAETTHNTTRTNVPSNLGPVPGSEGRDWLVSLILCIFLGCLGVHSFYNGKIGIGIAQILTCGGCGVWTLIDLIMICTGSYKDCDGNPLRNKI